MKIAISFLFALSCSFAQGQVGLSTPPSECGTSMPPQYSKWRNSIIHNNVSSLKHDLCVNKKLSIVFYVVADSNGAWGSVTPASISSCINNLNNVFGRICVTFMNCSTVVIPHHPFNRWTPDTIEPAVKPNWWTQSTINLYLPDSIVGFPAGYASMPGGPGNEIIVVEKSALGGMTPIHEMGHFFGLPHTWGEIGPPAIPAKPPGATSYEFVRRDGLKNCYTNGDGFCDTEADCYPLNEVPPPTTIPCGQLSGAIDGYGNYYIPPVDNYMTYFKGCRAKFSQEQYNFMAQTILTQLLYLH